SLEEMSLADQRLRNNSKVRSVEVNSMVEWRESPNDPSYAEQINLTRAGFESAWNLTTGGQTTEGAEIVLAILDAGFDVDHPDLSPNLWRNPAEIPNDGVDNDENGYVDDLFGWDLVSDAKDIPSHPHGTQVAGIIGAKGDNRQGVAGTNWDVKMMLFSFLSVADVIEAYEYIRYQRQLWNDTDGREGAFVVATNASFGIEGVSCVTYPSWGAMYDALGKEGILTAASVAGRSWNVDVEGDMPVDCPSDYLIGVANLDTFNVLHRSSGYGRSSVDLAAPGEASFTTRDNGVYGVFGGTSAAAPYVTGAIGLLYATPCPSLLNLSRSDPERAALLVRDAILGSTQANASLQARTSSGGSLEVAEAQRLLLESCDADRGEGLSITAIYPNPATEFTILQSNSLVLSGEHPVRIYDALGRLVRLQPAVREPGTPVRLRVDVQDLPSGWYRLEIEERGQRATTTLVVW
ncbi:MAG: S8/S53 family peptidase, partial [Bacteroidota bacterium]